MPMRQVARGEGFLPSPNAVHRTLGLPRVRMATVCQRDKHSKIGNFKVNAR